ncbi:TPA: hypothetical protein DEO28_01675 [Candidatus Dependentiae bacterium]|nr:MAG: hypothetical protein UR14_C0004G0023 [candidate division TM6 bacterium GW2011_GWE2_31_21]KKP52941.1 MAG: hypothetical protein UR43_C0008G0023 [candidate division TM6 bacterium GW2011_GWF2_33_332]HBS47818.1 hypothetical protein [Candidatus Dependentiae bacterium]HBZ73206.1 hypothetical protein [Candidatus Dependentiae bacterium]
MKKIFKIIFVIVIFLFINESKPIFPSLSSDILAVNSKKPALDTCHYETFYIDKSNSVIVCNMMSLEKIMSLPLFKLVKETKKQNFQFYYFKKDHKEAPFFIYVVVPVFKKEELHRDAFWKQRCDLLDYFKTFDLKIGSTQLLDIAIQACIICNGVTGGRNAYWDIALENSQTKFKEITNRYYAGETYKSNENVLNSEGYSHTKLFSWIYYVESLVIRKLCNSKGKISILEIGSSFGNSIFTKAELLTGANIKFLGIDINNELVDTAKRYVQHNRLENVEFLAGDITQPDWKIKALEKNQGQLFDVVTASHLLEHLKPSGNKHSLIDFIVEWFDMARYALVLSVPLEEEISQVSDHFDYFTVPKLEALTKEIRAIFNNQVEVDCNYIASGILIIKKQG